MLYENFMSELQTVRDWLRYSVSRLEQAEVFFGHGTDNALDESYRLVFGLLNLPLNHESLFLDARLTQPEALKMAKAIDQRTVDRLPTAYLTGEAWFCELPFKVTQDTLIPRSPIAELIENEFAPWLVDVPERVLDLCTGSGCIGLAVAHYFADAEVHLSDLSQAALQVARRNADRHGLAQDVVFWQSDLFDSLDAGDFDLIVTNPPYVDRFDMDSLPPEFRHEPTLALAAGDDGLSLVHRILAQSADFLSDQGVLICEVGNSAEALSACYPDVPFMWIEFERGGDGVFLLDKQTLLTHQALFAAQLVE